MKQGGSSALTDSIKYSEEIEVASLGSLRTSTAAKGGTRYLPVFTQAIATIPETEF